MEDDKYTSGGQPPGDQLGLESESAYVMAGMKEEGRGRAAFHAVHTTNNHDRISACGLAACGTLFPLSEAPEGFRCRAAGCRAAFKLAAQRSS